MTFNHESSILLVERVVELLQVLQFVLQLLLWKNQSRYSEMVSAWSLLESASRNQSNTSVLQHLQTVEKVRGLSLSCFHCFVWELDLWEGVHGTFNLIAGNIFHSPQEVCHQACSFLQWIEQRLVLSLISDSSRFLDILEWRVAHEVDHELTNWVGAKVDTFELDELVGDFGVEVVHVHVSSSETTFSQKSLWDWMKRNKLACVLVFSGHWVEDSVGWHEDGALLVNIFSVNLELVDKLPHLKSAQACSWLKTQWFFGWFRRWKWHRLGCRGW